MFPLSSAGSHSPSPTRYNYLTFALIVKLILTFLHSNWWFKSKLLLHSFLLLLSSLQLLLHLLTRKFWLWLLASLIIYRTVRTGPDSDPGTGRAKTIQHKIAKRIVNPFKTTAPGEKQPKGLDQALGMAVLAASGPLGLLPPTPPS